MSLHSLLEQELTTTTNVTPDSFARFAELIDPNEIESILTATSTASIRRRKIPAERVVWLVIGLALFRNEPIWQVQRQLDLVLRKETAPIVNGAVKETATIPMGNIAHSALIQARHRLGKKPMQLLFSLLAKKWDDEQRKMAPLSTGFCGLSNYAVDGVVWSVPETKENALSFGRNGSTSAWPQIRAVCLVNTESRIVRDIAFGDYPNGELTYAKDLGSSAPDFSLTIFDRLYYSASLLINWNKDTREGERIERHWLVRSRDTIRHEVLHTFGEGDVHVRLITSPQAKKKDPSLPEYWEARLIEREIDGKTYKFLTSLMDAQKYDASKIAAYYVERWEIELAYREVKQGLLEGELVLRSKLPELIEQEVWGMFLAYESDSYGDGQYGPRSSYIPKTIELSRNIPLYCISTDSLANGNTCNISRQTEVAQITSTVLYSSTQKTQKVSKSGQATVMKVSYKKYQ